ncbi:hypothetical protein M0D69_01065 [Caballeronia sp. SEWSISQ10-4 2]|uniref:hypothetical protein n=1 Tax=Caballeronia sp. SEWSISQ10-4 2 TaxID=2937438 RepID=UPI002651CAC4|nr:hypothetical protein [Caballeronia sp. SEWSISQ10-4 2]MDN7176634.1 hypothetical protein [Caballeronia sp. SEWSISQ10-4 2]
MAGMEAPSERKKETRGNAWLGASAILGGSGRKIRSEIRQISCGSAQACAAARAASRKPVFVGFSVVSLLYQGQIIFSTPK